MAGPGPNFAQVLPETDALHRGKEPNSMERSMHQLGTRLPEMRTRMERSFCFLACVFTRWLSTNATRSRGSRLANTNGTQHPHETTPHLVSTPFYSVGNTQFQIPTATQVAESGQTSLPSHRLLWGILGM